MDNKLTSKQEAWAQAFVKGTPDTINNATQSALKAGYSSNGATVAGTRMLAHASVQERVRELRSSEDNILAHSRDQMLTKLWETYDKCTTPTDIERISARISKVMGWEAPTRFEDSGKDQDFNRGIRERQLEAQVEQLERKCTQLKSIIEGVGEHETRNDQRVKV